MPIEQIDNSDHALFLDEDAQGSVPGAHRRRRQRPGHGELRRLREPDRPERRVLAFRVRRDVRDAESGLYAMSGGVYDPATGQGLKGLIQPQEVTTTAPSRLLATGVREPQTTTRGS